MSLELKRINTHGYSDCLLLKNKKVRVVIEPNCGGRVLEYSLKDHNIIYTDPVDDGFLLEPGKNTANEWSPSGGRFDIGPEHLLPQHQELWLGKWRVVHADELGVVLRSKKSESTGLQLERFFKLNKSSSNLLFTQTIRNISDEPKSCFHHSRTQVKGGGVFISPVSKYRRFPKGFVLYTNDHSIDFLPEQCEAVSLNHENIVVKGNPYGGKMAFESKEGWMAYLIPGNLLFIKQFHVFEDRDYGEIVSNNMSLLYGDKICELSPIGPLVHLQPGQEDSFTEEWWLLTYPFKEEFKHSDVEGIRDIIKEL